MSTIGILPEKRNDLGLSEPPPEKRAKLEVDDTVMEVQSNSNSEESKSSAEEATKSATEGSSTGRVIIPAYCEICHGHVGHKCWDCPNRSEGMGMCCPKCYGPCKVKDGDPRVHWEIEMVKRCVECGSRGDHWVDDCPSWIEYLRIQMMAKTLPRL